ncbi:MAG TPA: hypothetical protein VGB56_06250, partial [Flavisolibacter sp.]
LGEQPKYLVYRPGKKYTLHYWNNGWVALGTKEFIEGSPSLDFDEVPRNALLLLVPEYSKGKDRPFIITDEGQRLWF